MRTTNTTKIVGVDYVPVKVECSIEKGIGIHLVGLADQAVKESLLRTITAMQSGGWRIPGKKIVINLAPADLCKSGEAYDLPMALAMIAESGQADLWAIESLVIVGELGLDGSVRGVPGVVQAVRCAMDHGFGCIIPEANADEVAGLFPEDAPIWVVNSLSEAVEVAGSLQGVKLSDWAESEEDAPEPEGWWDRIAGQFGAKRALEIAAAGGHHLLLMGAPGSGKAALAKAMIDILPPLTHSETMEVASVWSAAGKGKKRGRPFRAPHYSSSMASIFGGGAGERLRPGEVSLSHRGVLYMDEWPCMPNAMREALRGPLEDGKVTISRLHSKVDFPSKFQLVIGSNPCVCGYYGEGDRCTCTPTQREVYLSKLSGPVVDMVDVQCWVHSDLPVNEAMKGEPAAVVAERVAAARVRQIARQGKLNGELSARELPELGENAKEMAERIIEHMGMSARAWTRMIRMARTIADLDGCEAILPQHIAEAASYRFLDRRAI